MPRKHSVATLKRICFLNVAKNMDSYWCSDFLGKEWDQQNFLYIVGPFEDLTSDLVQELIDVLRELKVMKKHHMQVLIDSHVRKLDLNSCGPIVNREYIPKLIGCRCNKLTKLSLSRCNNLSPKALANMLSNLPLLRTLDLSGTKCSDSVLVKLSQHCPEVTDLNISSCPISCSGVYSLVFGANNERKQVSNLVRLNLEHTAVKEDALAMAIINLPSLRYLYHENICSALIKVVDLHQDQKTNLPGQCYSLKSHVRISYTIDCRAIAEVFPYITDIAISRMFEPIGTEVVQDLHAFKQLTRLSLEDTLDDPYIFQNFHEVNTLLKAVGSNLTELELRNILFIELEAVAYFCPKLKALHIHAVEDVIICDDSDRGGKVAMPFSNLEKLDIVLTMDDTGSFAAKDLLFLTSHAHLLREIYFVFVKNLTSEVFEDILLQNKLQFLESFVITRCDNLDGEAVLQLLLQDNQLRQLFMGECFNVKRADFTAMKRIAKENNYDIAFFYN